GSLSLSLRTLDAAIDQPLDSVRLSDLMREKSPVVEEKTSSIRIKVRRGTDTEVVEISN
ncbi:MAG: Flp pilus assembly protein CpaB, partial [Proteobacteria bacterium]|nr:Flp pilus assembly protein CpaB [Pseudomonadota bacterium]